MHSSAKWMVPEGGRHPHDVGAYAPLCGPTQSNIFGMAKHALLSVGNSTSNSTALIIGANVGRSGSDFVFNGLKKLSLTRKIFVEPMPTLHREQPAQYNTCHAPSQYKPPSATMPPVLPSACSASGRRWEETRPVS